MKKDNEEQLPDITVAQDIIDADLKFLHQWHKKELQVPETKKFWNKTLGHTIKRIKHPNKYIPNKKEIQ